jgi:uncharacterized protein
MRGIGTLLNVSALLAGTVAGVLIGRRLPDRLRETVMAGMGLFGLALGTREALSAFGSELSGAVGPAAPLLVLGAMVAGAVVGELLDLEARLERLGQALQRRLLSDGAGRARFVEGFVLCSLVSCIGPLAVLGAFADGLRGDLDLLAVKSLFDGLTALLFASYLGWGVGASALVVLVYQGGLTTLAAMVEQVMTAPVLASMTAVGGLLIIAVALRVLELRSLRVANFLPAVVICPAATALLVAVR